MPKRETFFCLRLSLLDSSPGGSLNLPIKIYTLKKIKQPHHKSKIYIRKSVSWWIVMALGWEEGKKSIKKICGPRKTSARSEGMRENGNELIQERDQCHRKGQKSKIRELAALEIICSGTTIFFSCVSTLALWRVLVSLLNSIVLFFRYFQDWNSMVLSLIKKKIGLGNWGSWSILC